MVERNFILGRLPKFQGKKILLLQNQTTDDIINEMIAAHKLHKADYDRISNYFWKGNLKDTAQYIFDFLKRNVKYSIEPDVRQSVKSPAGILATGYYKNGYNDCKHYSQFISGILDSLRRSGKNIQWKYRFANYRSFTDELQHVFIVATDGKKEYWIDPVLNSFDLRKPYINKIDKKMSLYKISGVENLQSVAGTNTLQSINGGAIGRRKKAGKPKKKRVGIFKKIKNVVSKVSMAPSRAAFMAVLAINPKNMAGRLAQTLKSNKRDKLLKTWQKLGGNPKALEKAVLKQVARRTKRLTKKGKKVGLIEKVILRKVHKKIKARRRKPGFKNNPVINVRQYTDAQIKRLQAMKNQRRNFRRVPVYDVVKAPVPVTSLNGVNGDGIGAVQLVAVLAAAAPVITALAAFLPKNMKADAQGASDIVPEIAAAQQSPQVQEQSNTPNGMQTRRLNVDYSEDENERRQNLTDAGDSEDQGGGSGGKMAMPKIDNKTLLIAGAAAAGMYLFSKKR